MNFEGLPHELLSAKHGEPEFSRTEAGRDICHSDHGDGGHGDGGGRGHCSGGHGDRDDGDGVGGGHGHGDDVVVP